MRPITVTVAVPLLVVFCIGFGLSLYSGVLHDYQSYMRQWEVVLLGFDPWVESVGGQTVPRNAYGPLHALLGLSYYFGILVPKLILALSAWLVFSLLLIAAGREKREIQAKKVVYLSILFALSPLVVVQTYIFGTNDVLVALFCVIACTLRARNLLIWAGVALGLGALLKFYPLLFAAFLAIGKDRVLHVRLPAAAACVFAAGMVFSVAIMEWSAFAPFEFGSERGAKGVSILVFGEWLVEKLGFYPLELALALLLDANALIVLLVTGLVALWGWAAGLGWRITLILGILAIFTAYKVGHPQFFITFAAVVAWVIAEGKYRDATKVALSFVPVLAFLSLAVLNYALSFQYTDDGELYFLSGRYGYLVRIMLPLPYSILVAWGLYAAREVIFHRTIMIPRLRL